jgi:small conductance mechanosensitive channel
MELRAFGWTPVSVPTPASTITPLNDFDQWLRGNALEIVLILLGAVLLGRFATWLRDRLTVHIDEGQDDDAIVRSEQSKHRKAVTQIVAWIAVVLIWTISAAIVIHLFGIPFPTLVAPLTAGGVALGLGAQRLVGDLIGGSFIIAERQYGLGDLVQIAATPQTDGASGTVEDITLRITRLRTADGERVIIPNGQVVQVTNLSSDWARAVVDVPIPQGSDIARATALLHRIGEEAYEDDELRPLLLDAPTVMGVESFEDSHVRLRVVPRTQPGRQFDVARRLRVRIAAGFQREGFSTAAGSSAAPPASES